MTDRPRRRTGRPRLDESDTTAKLTLSLPSKAYDAIYRAASSARMSVPEFIRQQLRRRQVEPTEKA